MIARHHGHRNTDTRSMETRQDYAQESRGYVSTITATNGLGGHGTCTLIQREHMLNIDTQETMAQFTERLKEELAAEELCRQANMTEVDTIDDLVELYRPRSQGDMSDSSGSGRDGTSLV